MADQHGVAKLSAPLYSFAVLDTLHSGYESMSKLRVFIASPGDVKEEREIVSHVVQEISRMFSETLRTELEPVLWETHGWPDVGDDAQDVINKEIGEYDVLVGIMWQRFGTPTKRAGSGTGEEFERAYNYFKKYQRPKIMFYFRNTPFYTTEIAGIRQFQKVIRFRKNLEQLGVLFWEYDTPLEFERNVREHLIRQVFQLTESKKNNTRKTKATESRKPSHSISAKSPTPAYPESPRIFLSYASPDRPLVERVYSALKAVGFAPWFDIQDLLPGQFWKDKVSQAIRDADFFIVFMSRHTVKRPGFFHHEIRAALDTLDQRGLRETYIVPVRLEPVDPPIELAHYQWIDYFQPDGVERLITAITSAMKDRKIRFKRNRE